MQQERTQEAGDDRVAEKLIMIGDRAFRVGSDDIYLDNVGENFEPAMVGLFTEIIRPEHVVADIGANIGLTSMLFSRLAARVHAFEPSPSTFKLLQRNLDSADARNVTAHDFGLGASAGRSTITYSVNNRSGGFVSERIQPKGSHVTEEIAIHTMDEFFLEKSIKPDFIKIDVEGFEKSVIEGGLRTIRENKPIVVAEMNLFCLDVLQRITIPDFLDFIRSVFPYAYAMDDHNAAVENLADPERAYLVMHQHVVRRRFPNLVCGFVPQLGDVLTALVSRQRVVKDRIAAEREFATPVLADFSGSLEMIDPIDTLCAGEVCQVRVRVTNRTSCDWIGYGSNPVRLSYHWIGEDDGASVFEGKRTDLANKVMSAASDHDQIVQIGTPERPGKYQLLVTLVQERVAWFETKGFAAAALDVVVRG